MPPPASLPDIHATLRQVFGFQQFREGQERVVQTLLAGKPVLAIFPTGAGKSLCYQLPALHLDGVTLVISPLIALMKDQVDFLRRKNVPCAQLNSSLAPREAHDVLKALTAGKLKLLYVAPERLANERFLHMLRRLKIGLLAIDEAHCISEWGHNFRPDYLKLAQLARELKLRRVLALTATATPAVEKDIARSFGIEDSSIVHTGFYRPNLTLCITPCRADEKLKLLQQRLAARPRGATIVYVTLRETAEMVALALSVEGFPAQHYHAGMESTQREAVQNWFMAEEAPIVVATIAFGMGIDKSNIRAIYHYNLPKSLENYAQEIGRAGRDDKPAICEMLASFADRRALENFIYGDTPAPQAIVAVVEELFRMPSEFDLLHYELSARHDIRPLVLETLLTYLELDGVLQSTGPFYVEYQFQPLRPSKEILARFDPQRAEFLRTIFKQASKGRTWYTINVCNAASELNEPLERIAAALTYLGEQGDLVLQMRGQRHGYRRKDLPRSERDRLCRELAQRFLDRERRDLERLQKVLDYAEQPGCATAHLLHYFGDDNIEHCGHCNRCAGEPALNLPSEPEEPTLGPDESRLLDHLRAEEHPALATPRQITRFLCGLTSPAATRAKLSKDPRFGRLASHSFLKVLHWVEEAFGRS